MSAMLRGIDISNWQSGLDVSSLQGVDFVICKATEGTGFVDSYCDGWVQQCRSLGKPWGFYHFAGYATAVTEATFFINNTSNYFGEGIPVLDWEGDQTVSWVNEFVEVVHDQTGVWPWIYANPWRFNQGGVNENCMRWVASYPDVAHPSFEQAESWDCPETQGLVGCWQFCSDGRVAGYTGMLDCNLFYGSVGAWEAYAHVPNSVQPDKPSGQSVLENDEYRVVVERK